MFTLTLEDIPMPRDPAGTDAPGARTAATATGPSIVLESAHDLFALDPEVATPPGLRIGEHLLEAGEISEEALAEGLAYKARVPHRRLGWILVVLGLIRQEQLDRVLARRVGVPCVSIRRFRTVADYRDRLPVALARKLGVAVLHEEERTAWVAFADAMDPPARELARFALGKRVVALQAPRSEIDEFYRRYDPTAMATNNPYYDASHRRRYLAPDEALAAPAAIEFTSPGAR